MKPKAAPAHFPYTAADGHRTMAEVMADEQRQRDASKLRRVSHVGRRAA